MGAKCLAFICMLIVILSCFSSVNTEIGQLPFCKPSKPKDSRQSSLLYVSTLDGRVSALDLLTGELKWNLELDGKPLLSSNIHSRELNNNGQWVRLIPSLKGDLYKFDGERVEPLPVTAEQLLKSSVRYTDNLVFSGGEETRSYRIHCSTGKIISECTMHGCTNKTDGLQFNDEDLVVVQRYQSTVRASDPRSGVERWNFSVGQHKLSLIHSSSSDCSSNEQPNFSDIEIKFDLPNGIVTAFNKTNSFVDLWKHKFDAPIASIWKENEDIVNSAKKALEEVNLFDNPWITSDISDNPALYVAMHDKQLYIQRNPTHTGQEMFPWRPYPAIEFEQSKEDNRELALVSSETASTTAISVLYNSEYINGNGFYLYSNDQLEYPENTQCNKTVLDGINFTKETPFLDEEETPVQIIIVSIWYYWKEIIVISFTTAIMLNCIFDSKLNFLRRKAKETVLEVPVADGQIVTKEREERKTSVSEDDTNFSSRFLTDFEPVIRLGKGGFGIVFEAKNKIDDCNYAIKRITLPNSQDSRDRVMREVKALAKLEHQNIVRYFNAWLECPPNGWQEEQDDLMQKNGIIPIESELTHEMSRTETETESKMNNSMDNTNGDKSLSSAIEALDSDDDSDDDFIQFKNPEDEDQTDGETIDNESSNSTETSEVARSECGEEILKIENERSESIVFQDSKIDQSRLSCCVRTSKTNSIVEEKPKVRQKAPKMYLYIQMQLCQRKSLRDWLKNCDSPRDMTKAIKIFREIVDAVDYVHLQGLIHRDLKPSNIFFALNEKVKVGDFGLVTAMPDATHCAADLEALKLKNEYTEVLRTAEVGTHLYMAPEQMEDQKYNYKVDIYSLGIILFEILTPFSTDMERIQSLTNLRRSEFPKNFAVQYPAEYELLKLMLDNDPKKRPTTLGIKARFPFCDDKPVSKVSPLPTDEKWHFELPPISRSSSLSNTESNNSVESISN